MRKALVHFHRSPAQSKSDPICGDKRKFEGTYNANLVTCPKCWRLLGRSKKDLPK